MRRLFLRSTAAALCFILTLCTAGYASVSVPALALEQALRAQAALLMDANTGTVLLARNEHAARPVASLTKLMTMLLVLEAEAAGRVKWEDRVTVSAHAAGFGGSQIWLEAGETLTLEELFLSVAIESANDSAVALAEFVAGSEESFVALMNERVRLLDFGFANFEGRQVVRQGERVGDVPIAKGASQVVEAVAASDFYLLLPKGHRAPIETRTELLRTVAPVKAGETVGRLWVTTEGKEPAYVLLVAAVPVGRASWWQNFRRLWESLY